MALHSVLTVQLDKADVAVESHLFGLILTAGHGAQPKPRGQTLE